MIQSRIQYPILGFNNSILGFNDSILGFNDSIQDTMVHDQF